MEKIKLVKFKNPKGTSEIFQSLDIKFSFVNKEYEQITNPIKCRDFLGDCIWSRKANQPAQIYGFSYDWTKTPYDLDVLRLSLTFPDAESKEYFLTNIEKLHEKEEAALVENKTKVFETQDKQILVIEADKVWQSSIWKISLYTFYLKLISYESISELSNPEDKYWNTLESKEEFLLSKIQEENEFVYPDINYAHNYSGFVSCLKKQNIEQATILGL